MLLTLDVDDHIDPESREWLTLDEAGRIVRTPEHEARAAEIGVRFEAWRVDQAFDAEQARWAGLIGSRVRGRRDEHGRVAVSGISTSIPSPRSEATIRQGACSAERHPSTA